MWFHVYDVSRAVIFTETENRTVAAKGLELRKMESRNSMGTEFYQEEEVLVTGYTTVWIYLALLNCTFKNGQDGKFCVLYFTTIKNKSIMHRYGYKNLKKILANQVKQHIKRIIYHV